LASASRASSEKSSSPARTFWPSLIWTCVTVLVIWGRKSTDCSAVTDPLAWIFTGTSRDSDFVVTTSVVDGRPAPFASWLREVPKYHQPAERRADDRGTRDPRPASMLGNGAHEYSHSKAIQPHETAFLLCGIATKCAHRRLSWMAQRRMPVGAEIQSQGGVHFRVWAPRRKSVQVAHDRGDTPLAPEGGGYFSGLVSSACAGTRYRYRLDGRRSVSGSASRFQPEGPAGPSEVIDPSSYPMADAAWRGISLAGQVIYEMHVGTFTPAGTWYAACRELAALARLGVTVLEVMPVADFAGDFGWGYDGVDLFAPTRLYGTPDAFRSFVDAAHHHGLGVILDVVYNHLGPSGNYLREFAHEYFTDRYDNEWGDAINFDGEDAAAVREFFVANAGYWIDEFHLDGLRLDATQQIFDGSRDHIVGEVSRRVRAAARGRGTIVVGENEPQQVRLLRELGVDALWNDDFHHAAHVALGAHNEAYYSDYGGKPQELLSAVKHGFLYQGQWYSWQSQKRGTPALGVRPAAFVHYIQNHDQVANSARGLRITTSPRPGAGAR
jgi:maltooligosyltrehalose trehalohydrolase